MLIPGIIGLGVVWGWVLVQRLPRKPWRVLARMLLAAGAQLALVVQLAQPIGALWWAAGVAAGALFAGLWVRSLEQRVV